MAAADPHSLFLTPPPRHLAELRIDTAPSVVAFSAPCGAAKGAERKRRCLLPSSSVRKRMLLELDPFNDAAPTPSSTTPRPPTSRTSSPSPSPMASRAAPPTATLSLVSREFSFGTALPVVPPSSPGKTFSFAKNVAGTPAGSETRMTFLAPLGLAAKPAAGATANGIPLFLEGARTPTATGPTANGGFVFAAPPEGLPTPTSTNTSGGLSFFASPSPKQALTPMGSTATGGFLAPSEPSLMPAGKARTGSTTGTGDKALPSPGAACAQVGSVPSACAAAKGSIPLPADKAAEPPSILTASQSRPPPLRNSADGSDKRPSLFLRRAATSALRKSLRQMEVQQQLNAPPPQKIAETNALAAGDASRPSNMSGSSARPCCTFFTSPSKEAAKQEAEGAFSEASRSPSGSHRSLPSESHCSSPWRSVTLKSKDTLEREYEDDSSSARKSSTNSPSERAPTSPAVVCSGAEVVVHVTCKCSVHKEFCFDHRL